MELDPEKLRHALRRILEVERSHMFGAKTGSQTARRHELERELDRLMAEVVQKPAKGS